METQTRGGSERRKQTSKPKKSRVSNIGKVKNFVFYCLLGYKSEQGLSNECYDKAAWTSGYKDTVAI